MFSEAMGTLFARSLVGSYRSSSANLSQEKETGVKAADAKKIKEVEAHKPGLKLENEATHASPVLRFSKSTIAQGAPVESCCDPSSACKLGKK